jgi:hypothetical protein
MLSICIATIPARRSLLSRLLWTIQQQMTMGAVEVLIADGDWALGDKANTMFAAAKGSHVVLVDDDDNISAHYVGLVTSKLPKVDMVGYYMLWTEAGKYMASPFHHGEGHPTNGIEDRGACLKTPIRTEIARRHLMGNGYAADHEWAMEVHPEIETHATILRHCYLYDHWNDQMVGTDLNGQHADWYTRPQRDVGLWPHNPDLFTWITQ